MTEEEHDHLAKSMMIREVPGWQSGYIGAKALNYDTFDWVTGPAAEGGTFWFGLGTDGVPYRVSNRERMDLPDALCLNTTHDRITGVTDADFWFSPTA